MQPSNGFLRRCVLALGLSCLAAVCAPLTGADAPSGPASNPAKTAFERLKSLAGQWEGTVSRSDTGPAVKVIYRVTSNGSVVLETLFPGTDHEMMTVYHLDGSDLVLTHYCAMGNQPRMRLSAESTADRMVFEFTGGSNVRPDKDVHMHSGQIQFEGADTLVAEWDVYQNGKRIDSNKFFLKRKSA